MKTTPRNLPVARGQDGQIYHERKILKACQAADAWFFPALRKVQGLVAEPAEFCVALCGQMGCGSTPGCGSRVYSFQIFNSGISISRVQFFGDQCTNCIFAINPHPPPPPTPCNRSITPPCRKNIYYNKSTRAFAVLMGHFSPQGSAWGSKPGEFTNQNRS